MSNYTLILYRPNHTDYCRGCRMGSTNSEHKIVVCNSRQDAIDKYAQELFNNQMRDSINYASTRITLLVDGIPHHSNVVYDNVMDIDDTDSLIMIETATVKFRELVKEDNDNKKRIEEENKIRQHEGEINAKKEQELVERTQYERLKKKYGE